MLRTVVLLILLGQLVSGAAQSSSKKEFKRLMRLFEGQYNSVAVAGTPAEKQTLESMTITVTRMEGSLLGPNTFYIKYVRGNGSLYRQRLCTFTFEQGLIKSKSVGFMKDSLFIDIAKSPEKVKALAQTDLKSIMDCMDTWTKTTDGFVGTMNDCPFKSERRGGKEIFISSRMKVSKTGMATTEAGKDDTGKILFGKPDGYALEFVRQ
jgi:CpeT/CpcT family (DUF1001)